MSLISKIILKQGKTATWTKMAGLRARADAPGCAAPSSPAPLLAEAGAGLPASPPLPAPVASRHAELPLSWFHNKIGLWLPSCSLSLKQADIVLFFFLSLADVKGTRYKKLPTPDRIPLVLESRNFDVGDKFPRTRKTKVEVRGKSDVGVWLFCYEHRRSSCQGWRSVRGGGHSFWLRWQHGLDFLGQLRYSSCLLNLELSPLL